MLAIVIVMRFGINEEKGTFIITMIRVLSRPLTIDHNIVQHHSYFYNGNE